MPFIVSGDMLKFEYEGLYYPVGRFKDSTTEEERESYVENELNASKLDRHDEMLEWEVSGTYNFQ